MLQRGSGVSCILKRRPTEYSDCHPGSLFYSALLSFAFTAESEPSSSHGEGQGQVCLAHTRQTSRVQPLTPDRPHGRKVFEQQPVRRPWQINKSRVGLKPYQRERKSPVLSRRAEDERKHQFWSNFRSPLATQTSVRRRQITGAGVCGNVEWSLPT